MRKLMFKDVFAAMRILRTANVKKELAKLTVNLADTQGAKQQDELQKKLGVEAFAILLESLADKNAEKALYELLADICEDKNAEEIATLDFEQVMGLFKQIATKNDLKSFFASVLSLTTRA